MLLSMLTIERGPASACGTCEEENYMVNQRGMVGLGAEAREWRLDNGLFGVWLNLINIEFSTEGLSNFGISGGVTLKF